MSKKQQEALKRNYEKAQAAIANPELSYTIQEKFETLINAIAVVDDIIQDLSVDAPFLFRGSISSFKRLNKALDESMECIRKDFYHDERAALYEKTSTKIPLMSKIVCDVLWGIKSGNLLEIDTWIKTYLKKPSLEKEERLNFAIDYVSRHKKQMDENTLQTWMNYIEANKPKK